MININKKYLLYLNINGKDLTFTAEIIAIDENFITFKDKFGKILNYNINQIITYEEIKE